MATACSYFKFELIKQLPGGPRRGRIKFRRGELETPAFFPVGTVGSVKGVSGEDLLKAGFKGMLSNAFHIYLRASLEIIEKAGGLHSFISFPGFIVTDSGGFQIKSLAQKVEVLEEGMKFSSPFDGSRHILTPEDVVEIQERLDSDVKLPLDVCPSWPVDESEAKEQSYLTLKWFERALKHVKNTKQGFFGIVQGGFSEHLRREIARETARMEFHGFAVGGLSVGEPKELTFRLLSAVTEELPEDRIRYLMGMGKPQDIVHAVEKGVDMFDCVIPTRNARNGTIYTWSEGKFSIRLSRMKEDLRPLDPGCPCPACSGGYSRAFLAYLYRNGEILALRLLSLHNLYFFSELMKRIRESIENNTFGELKRQVINLFGEV